MEQILDPDRLRASRPLRSPARAARRGESTATVLVCDVDDTVLGDDEGLRRLAERLRRPPPVALYLNSSRPCASVLRSLQSLAEPLAVEGVFGALGTEVVGDDDLVASYPSWPGFDREPVDEAARSLELQAHDEEFQTAFKASFTAPSPERRERFIAALERGAMPLACHRHDERVVDVVPPGAGKGRAARHLADHLGIALESLIVAGDSENDRELLQVSPRRILVANATPRLIEGTERPAFLARGARAWGVLEGLEHFLDAPDGAGSEP